MLSTSEIEAFYHEQDQRMAISDEDSDEYLSRISTTRQRCVCVACVCVNDPLKVKPSSNASTATRMLFSERLPQSIRIFPSTFRTMIENTTRTKAIHSQRLISSKLMHRQPAASGLLGMFPQDQIRELLRSVLNENSLSCLALTLK